MILSSYATVTAAATATTSYPIDIWGVVVALVLVAAATAISGLLHLGLVKSMVISTARSLLQLLAMGLIIRFVIQQNNWMLVVALLVIMLFAAVQITLARAHGIPKGLALPVFLTLTVVMLLMVCLVTELMLRPQPWYAPQLVIPVTGMMLGNAVSAIALALSRYFEDMHERADDIEMLLALGATPYEAARPSILSSVRLGLIPTISTLASSGIVLIPGMMAGQVIAGADPLNAAEYQFVVLASLSALTLVGDIVIMMAVYKRSFTDRDQAV
ncbi:MAG: ABC transporter permease [Bifidobacteriaceae bacterium]|jgi:putative ABC transport system permease protein|nr:ABC transporter permease [Bifidobacteriaceae bacterium]